MPQARGQKVTLGEMIEEWKRLNSFFVLTKQRRIEMEKNEIDTLAKRHAEVCGYVEETKIHTSRLIGDNRRLIEDFDALNRKHDETKEELEHVKSGHTRTMDRYNDVLARKNIFGVRVNQLEKQNESLIETNHDLNIRVSELKGEIQSCPPNAVPCRRLKRKEELIKELEEMNSNQHKKIQMLRQSREELREELKATTTPATPQGRNPMNTPKTPKSEKHPVKAIAITVDATGHLFALFDDGTIWERTWACDDTREWVQVDLPIGHTL